MPRALKVLMVLASIGCGLSVIATSPAQASRPSAHSYVHHGLAFVGGTPARPNPRFYACNGGRAYTYLGGRGCDYYYYPGYPPRRWR
jgi:hypothetical protein